MNTLMHRPAAGKARCPHCGAPLERFEADGTLDVYCPDCTTYTMARQDPDWVDLARDDDDLVDLARGDV
jgi:NADH pyrophosphatase NudC (nudix superfamily)